MVHVVDEGSEFDAPIETIWAFLQSPADHGASHPERTHAEATPLGESTTMVSWEQDMNGKKVKVVSRVTAIPPLGLVVEQLEGPMAGSKAFTYYIPRGAKTGVTVVGEFKSPVVPEAQLEPMVRKGLANAFAQDSASLKTFAHPHHK